MRLLYIDKSTNFMVRFMERTLFEYCHQYVIEFEKERCHSQFFGGMNVPTLVHEKITLENVHKCQGIAFNTRRMRDCLLNQADNSDGFLYYTADKQNVVGCIWVMYKGGNGFQYRIRKVDAFGFDFGVMPKFRGNGIVGIMIHDLLNYLSRTRGITKLYASVRTNNRSAIRAYEKSGMRIVDEKKFCRIAGIRIPYPII